MMKCLHEDTTFSSIRLAMLLVVIGIVTVLGSIALYILYLTFTGAAIAWNGVAAVLASLTAPIAGAMGTKAWQKQKERQRASMDATNANITNTPLNQD